MPLTSILTTKFKKVNMTDKTTPKYKHYGAGRIRKYYDDASKYHDAVEALTALSELLLDRGIDSNLDEVSEEISLFSKPIYADFDASDRPGPWKGCVVFKDLQIVIPLNSPADLIDIVNESRKP